jgi:hypothetical protein
MSLDAAHRALEAGDFAEARRLACASKATAVGDAARTAAADEILRRTGVDPLVLWLTAGCALLFVAVVFFGLR